MESLTRRRKRSSRRELGVSVDPALSALGVRDDRRADGRAEVARASSKRQDQRLREIGHDSGAYTQAQTAVACGSNAQSATHALMLLPCTKHGNGALRTLPGQFDSCPSRRAHGPKQHG